MQKKRKTVSYRKHQERKRNITGKKVIGIDPAKEKHQVTVLDEHGIQIGEREIQGKISRADVADFMLNQLTEDTYLRQEVGISY